MAGDGWLRLRAGICLLGLMAGLVSGCATPVYAPYPGTSYPETGPAPTRSGIPTSPEAPKGPGYTSRNLVNPANGTRVVMPKGKALDIRFEARADAWYRWLISDDYAGNVLVMVRNEYAYDRKAGSDPMDGAQLFRFGAKADGKTDLHFYFASDPHSPKQKTVTIHVEVVG